MTTPLKPSKQLLAELEDMGFKIPKEVKDQAVDDAKMPPSHGPSWDEFGKGESKSKTASADAAFHLPGQHNQADHAGGKGSQGARRYDDTYEDYYAGAGNVPHKDPKAVEQGLAQGKKVTINEQDVDACMRDFASGQHTNMANLQVEGQPNMYQHHLRDIPRAKMPQLPETPEEMAKFSAALAKKGIHASMMDVDPRSLQATQSELDSQKVGKLYGYIKDGGWRGDSTIITSKEGAILDGHHRWAAAAAARETGSNFTVHNLRVDTDIDTLLDISLDYSPRRAGLTEGLRAAAPVEALGGKPLRPPPNETQPWLWVVYPDGKGDWVLIVTDTSDEVPPDLSYLKPRQP